MYRIDQQVLAQERQTRGIPTEGDWALNMLTGWRGKVRSINGQYVIMLGPETVDHPGDPYYEGSMSGTLDHLVKISEQEARDETAPLPTARRLA